MRHRLTFALVASLVLALPSTALPSAAATTPAGLGAAAPTTVLTTPAAGPGASATEAPAADRMPGDVPTRRTPWILDGEVTKVVQVGEVMVAGGLFTQVTEPMNGAPHTRQNLVAFDATTGAVSEGFQPQVNGQVQQLLPGPTPGTVYVAGDFTKINGKGPNHLQLLDVTTGLAVPSFKAPSTNGGIETMDLLPGGRLFIGGFFTRIGGVPRGQLATLNASTGTFDPFLDLVTSGRHNNTGAGVQAPVGARESGVTPAGDRLVVVGNFRVVDGLPRDQIVMIDLTGPTAAVSTTWYTTRYTPVCSPRAFDSYMRDVEMSPDGSFLVVATTGGPIGGTLCDTAARFETYAVGTALSPTWVASSGGDTLWGVEITQAAVFVGGHNRWMNNPSGSDRAGQGAVPRPGLSALDPESGVPLRWNPGRNPRGEAAYEIHETDAGLWVVSDTDWIGNRRYQRPRIAFFPYSEGSNTASQELGTLPGSVYVGAPLAKTNVLYRVNAGGPALASTDAGPDWSSDNAATSPFRNTGSTTANQGALSSASLVGVPASTPLGIWATERTDPSGGNELQWTFPVPSRRAVQVRLFFASRSSSTRRFSVLLDAVPALTSYDPNLDPGLNRGTMKSFNLFSDGSVDIDLTHVVGNPEINAVEILDTVATGNSATASVVAFDGTTVGSRTAVSTPAFSWSAVRGAMMVGRTLFYAQSDGYLYRRSFDGSEFGDPAQVNPYIDPLWSSVETGSGPAGQTYVGVLPTWYSQLSTVTGMFYAGGRVYYTRTGQNALFWRWFSPDSGIVAGVENTAPGGDVAWSGTRGMFLDAGTLYVVDSGNGQLRRTDFVGGAPRGVSSLAETTTDWRGAAVFLASVRPNVAPTAAFTSSCTGLSCTFAGSGSSDRDGTVSSYEWSFSDGDEAGGPSPQKGFAGTGTYTATLTVTDDGGLTSSMTQEVSVVTPNLAPTAAFTATCTYLECDLDAGLSRDDDGTLSELSWDFGDDQVSSGGVVHHGYDQPGSYTIRLVVTDDDGAEDDASTVQVVVAAPTPSTVSFVGAAGNQGNAVTPNVTTPGTVSAGDRLLLVLSVNSASRTVSAPSGVSDWTVLSTTTSGSMLTQVLTKVATATDGGRKVSVRLDAAAKYTMSVAAYAGTRPGVLVHAAVSESVTGTGHTTPVVAAPPGSWVISTWADKTSATTGFTLPDAVTGRLAICSTGSGRVCSTLADSGSAVPAGPYGGLVAAADAPSGTATTSSVVLRTREANRAPTAAFTFTCTSTVCTFDAAGSSDVDGSVATYSWDFGDGAVATGPAPGHDFTTSGERPVTLTVTDDEGAQASILAAVAVLRTNAAPTAAFTASCVFLVCQFDAGSSADSDGQVLSYAWDFGDGQVDTTSGPDPTHSYSTGGDVVVTLTVTDNDAGTATTTRTATPAVARPIALVGSTVNQGNVSTPNTSVPAGTAPGDRLLMLLSLNDATRIVGATTGVSGWTLVDTVVSGSMQTLLYTKLAAPGDGGRTVRFSMDAPAKYTLTVAVYSGDQLEPQVAVTPETVLQAEHTTPTVQAGAGDWAVSYWADKSSTTTVLAPAAGVVARQATCGANGGRVCSLLADTGGALPPGPYGSLTATADSTSATATMWTILLRHAG